MERILPIYDTVLTGLYFALFILYLRAFFDGFRVTNGIYKTALPAVLVLHFVRLTVSGFCQGSCPVLIAGESFSFIAFVLGVIYLLIERKHQYYSTGLGFVGIIFVFQAIASVGAWETNAQILRTTNIPFGFHAPVALIGVALFAASALYGAMYLLLFWLLKSKHLGSFLQKIPPLEKIASIQKFANIAGVVFFAIALAAGAVLGIYYGRAVLFDPKVVMSIAVLAIFTWGIIGSAFFSYSDKSRSIISIAGFAVAVISMTLVRYCSPTFHHF